MIPKVASRSPFDVAPGLTFHGLLVCLLVYECSLPVDARHSVAFEDHDLAPYIAWILIPTRLSVRSLVIWRQVTTPRWATAVSDSYIISGRRISDPSRNRLNLYGEMSVKGVSFMTISLTRRPAPGPIANPCPLKPAAMT